MPCFAQRLFPVLALCALSACGGPLKPFSYRSAGGVGASASGASGAPVATNPQKLVRLSLSEASFDFGNEAKTGSRSHNVTLTNNGETDITDLSFSGLSGPFSQSGSCDTTLMAGASCSLIITFSPADTTLSAQILTASYSDPSLGKVAITENFTGTGITPASLLLSNTEANYDFGNVSANTSLTHVLTITNTGEATATNLGIALPSGAYLSQANTCGTTLGGSGSGANTCTVTISFAPSAAGKFSRNLTVAYNSTSAVSGTDVTVADAMSGTALTDALLSFSETAFDFGKVARSGSALHQIMISNGGQTKASTLSFSGLSGIYSQTNTCGTELLPGTSCTLTVTHSPIALGTSNQTLTLGFNDGAANRSLGYALSGTGAAAASLDFGETGYAFGSVPATTATTHTLTVTNNGDAPATGISVIGLSAPFSQTNTCGTSLAGGATCKITVTYAPTAAGTLTLTLTVAYNTGTGAAKVTDALSGTALSDASLSLGGALGGFGNVPVNGSVRHDLTVTNSGQVTATNLAIGGLSAPFSQTSDCGASLAPSATCTVHLTFAPTATGLVSPAQTLSIAFSKVGAASGTDSTATQALSGTGVGDAALTASEASFAFGTVLVNALTTHQITISNTGASTATNLAVTGLSGDYSADSSACGSSLAPNSSCAITVSYSPKRQGTSSQTLTLSYSKISAAAGTDTTANDTLSASVTGPTMLYIADCDAGRIRMVGAPYGIYTIAGNGTQGSSGDGGPAASAQINTVTSVAFDPFGSFFIADYARIRKITPNGIISTYAGNGTDGSGPDGPAIYTSINLGAIAFDASGILYFTEPAYHRVRKILPLTTTPTIATIAGTGVPGYGGDGGSAASAQLNGPSGIAVDSQGNVYVADYFNFRVRKVSTSGIITTVAGTGVQGYGGDGGPATAAKLDYPGTLTIDSHDNLYISDGGSRIRKVSASTGIITTIAGTGTTGLSGDGGPATSAQISGNNAAPVTDAAGNLYFVDGVNSRIRKIDTNGIITTIAGSANGYSGDGGPAINAKFNLPEGLTIDKAGNLYIGDQLNLRIRKLMPQINTVAGSATAGFAGDGGPATSASLNCGFGGVALDRAGNLFIADQFNNRIRKVDSASGNITTVAGNGTAGYSGDGGPATSAKLNQPISITLDARGNLFIADYQNFVVRRVDATTHLITTIAGNGIRGYSGDGGAATAAQLQLIQSMAVDGAGNIYISDTLNFRLRKVDTAGIITTVAGTGTQGFSGDGGPASTAQLTSPGALVFDLASNLYLKDGGRIRKIDLSGMINTVAGNGTTGADTGDYGSALSAGFNGPTSLAVDSTGNLYIGSPYEVRVVRNGIISPLVGNYVPGFNGDGGPAALAQLAGPAWALAVMGTAGIGP